MTPLSRRSLLAALPLLAVAGRLAAQQAPERRGARVPEYRIFDTPPATHSLSRLDVEVDGDGYRLFIAVPVQPAPAGGWPSIWMLDGNSVFDRITADHLESQPGLVVIGVGYQIDQTIDTMSRSRDYTPVSLTPAQESPGRAGRPTGGADVFRGRLTGPLRAAVEAQVPLDPARRVLWGHSYGGLFTLHCLLSDPQAFAGWAPTSPSTGFGGGVLAQMAGAAPQLPGGQVAPVRIMLGDSEHRSGTEAPPEPRPASSTLALGEALKQRADLQVEITVFEGLGHGQTFAASFPAALALAAGTAG